MIATEHTYPRATLQDLQRESFVSFLDLARWSAASIVFLGHLRDPLFQGYASVPQSDRNAFVQIWYFVSGLSYEAVIVFFVLSGYLVGGMATARMTAGTFSVRDYAVDRLTRLYVALLPALVLTALLDKSGQDLFGNVGFWNGTHPLIAQKFPGRSFASSLTTQDFLQNVCMTQTIRSSPFGSDQPLWTISLEFWFYAVFGIAAATIFSLSWRRRCVGVAVLGIAGVWLGAAFPLYMGMWLLGISAAAIPWRRLERPLVAGSVFAIALGMARVVHPKVPHDSVPGWGIDYFVAIAFAWLLVSMRSNRLSWLQRTQGFNRFMADFSYSLYLVHFPLMLFVLAVMQSHFSFSQISTGYSPMDGQGLIVYVLTIGIVYLGAWLFSQGTERRTPYVRKQVKNWLQRVGTVRERA